MECQHKQKYVGNFLARVIKQVHSSTLNSYRSWISVRHGISATNRANFDLHYFIWKWQKYEFFQASHVRDTRLSGSAKEETMKSKRKGNEERTPFARTAGERKTLQLLCWPPPSLSLESMQVLGLLVGCDLLADGTSDELQAATGSGQWPPGGNPAQVRAPSVASERSADARGMRRWMKYISPEVWGMPCSHAQTVLLCSTPGWIQHFSSAGL